MNRVIKQQWLEALLSEEYQQGQCELRNADDEYCCLGVLLDLAIKEGVVEDWQFDDEGSYTVDPGRELVWNIYLPQVVVDWAGLPNGDPNVTNEDVAKRIPNETAIDFEAVTNDRLSAWNDSTAVGFKGIAALIDANL